MIAPESRPRWLIVLLCALAVATVLGWSSVAFVYFGMNAFGRSYPFGRAVLAGLMDWYFWAAVTPLVFWLGQRVRLERSPWVGAVGVHLAAGAAVALVEILVVTLVGRAAGMGSATGTFRDAFVRLTLQYFHFDFIIYWVIVAAAHAARYYASFRSRELEAARLRAGADAGTARALQMQLQPHFLFNTLHTIASLVREGRAGAATDTLAALGELLRRTLGDGDRHESSLADELGFVQGYLEIERTRFSDRLAVSYDVPADAMQAMIPRMALQPLAENAIRHGIARDPDARPGRRSRAARRRSGCALEVDNDGPPWDGETHSGNGPSNGVGLANVRARLGRLYGAALAARALARRRAAAPSRSWRSRGDPRADRRRRAGRPDARSGCCWPRTRTSRSSANAGRRRHGGRGAAPPAGPAVPRHPDARRHRLRRARGAAARRDAAGGLRHRLRPLFAPGLRGARRRLPAEAVQRPPVPERPRPREGAAPRAADSARRAGRAPAPSPIASPSEPPTAC